MERTNISRIAQRTSLILGSSFTELLVKSYGDGAADAVVESRLQNRSLRYYDRTEASTYKTKCLSRSAGSILVLVNMMSMVRKELWSTKRHSWNCRVAGIYAKMARILATPMVKDAERQAKRGRAADPVAIAPHGGAIASRMLHVCHFRWWTASHPFKLLWAV